jgi:hypothetical protein
MLRLFWINILITVASVVYGIVDAIRTRHSYWRDLGRLWYVRGFYSPETLGIGVDFNYASRDDFELAVDFGPFTVAVGRDFTF